MQNWDRSANDPIVKKYEPAVYHGFWAKDSSDLGKLLAYFILFFG